MLSSISKALDSALLIAILSALLYFLGVANIRGDSAAFGVPRAVLQGDVSAMVAAGADGLLVAFMSPFTLLTSRVDWLLFFLMLVVPGALLVALWLWRRLPFRIYALAAVGFVGLYVFVFFCSLTSARSALEFARMCVMEDQCDQSMRSVRLRIELSDEVVEFREGVILNMNSNYVVVLTRSSTVVVPTSSIKLMERPART